MDNRADLYSLCMDNRADLHIHTMASDGALTPTQVVQAASKAGLRAVAITDHDTVDGIEEALCAGRKAGVEVVPGVEISAIFQEKVEVHILGYFINHSDPVLREILQTLKDARFERGERMVALLNAAGVPVSFERVKELARGGAMGRPHVARAICEVGAASSMDSAFGKFLAQGKPGFVPRKKISPFDAVKMIREAGGVACCAHVAKLNRVELVLELAKAGLRGIEVYHPDHGSAGMKFYLKFARSRNLIATGGSDAHGFESGKFSVVGQVSVDYEVVEHLRSAAEPPNPAKPSCRA